MWKTVLLIAVLAAAAGCNEAGGYGEARVEINGVAFEAEVPLTEDGFRRGLMFRESLGDREAMLFAYPDSAVRTFWMKNTLIPLDLLFIDEAGTVRKISYAVPCGEDPCEFYGSGVPARYVLEVRGNLTGELGIREGDSAVIEFLGGGGS